MGGFLGLMCGRWNFEILFLGLITCCVGFNEISHNRAATTTIKQPSFPFVFSNYASMKLLTLWFPVEWKTFENETRLRSWCKLHIICTASSVTLRDNLQKGYQNTFAWVKSHGLLLIDLNFISFGTWCGTWCTFFFFFLLNKLEMIWLYNLKRDNACTQKVMRHK